MHFVLWYTNTLLAVPFRGHLLGVTAKLYMDFNFVI